MTKMNSKAYVDLPDGEKDISQKAATVEYY